LIYRKEGGDKFEKKAEQKVESIQTISKDSFDGHAIDDPWHQL